MPWRRWLSSFVGAVVLVSSIAGIPEGLSKWASWLGPVLSYLNSDVGRWLLGILGVFILANAVQLLQAVKFLTGDQAIAPAVQASPTEVTTPIGPDEHYFRDRTVRIVDVAGHFDHIRGCTFEGCTILGPAVLAGFNRTVFDRCTFDGPPLVLPVRTRLFGVIGVEDCVFLRCAFRRIDLLSGPEFAEKFEKDVFRPRG